ncbi:hypothetical protein IPC1622_15445 [Pseudomonas aeruginosa]|uniref:hypothetical protein n=1 Tax=Pseudomonas aeruginosa TaxID=287 RepID=UPI000F85CDA8|nr:hypothetical protein [Pseudomonas aeruginosa]MCQ9819273.1 hypothetical protein [Pseudomonas aeruginosa]RUA49463.1 hypothetical protein IPC1622_15445 [Pseudomonas aeruginosa]
MSAKVNVAFVLRKHFSYTLKDADGVKVDWFDVLIFIALPLILGTLSYFSKSASSDNAISIIITASSIFAGLLLSLLMLVYDQSKRTEERLIELNTGHTKPSAADNLEELLQGSQVKSHPLVSKYEKHLRVLEQLVVNISYSIVASLFVIFVCVVSLLITKDAIGFSVRGVAFSLNLSWLFFAVAVAVSANLVVTLLMIVKRVIRLIDDK